MFWRPQKLAAPWRKGDLSTADWQTLAEVAMAGIVLGQTVLGQTVFGQTVFGRAVADILHPLSVEFFSPSGWLCATACLAVRASRAALTASTLLQPQFGFDGTGQAFDLLDRLG
jgi:hypothetical protein